MHVARMAAGQWNADAATSAWLSGRLTHRRLRRYAPPCPDLPLLVPGVGAQSGELAGAARAAADGGGERVLLNASRSVLYASSGQDFAAAARAEAERLRSEINQALAFDSVQ